MSQSNDQVIIHAATLNFKRWEFKQCMDISRFPCNRFCFVRQGDKWDSQRIRDLKPFVPQTYFQEIEDIYIREILGHPPKREQAPTHYEIERQTYEKGLTQRLEAWIAYNDLLYYTPENPSYRQNYPLQSYPVAKVNKLLTADWYQQIVAFDAEVENKLPALADEKMAPLLAERMRKRLPQAIFQPRTLVALAASASIIGSCFLFQHFANMHKTMPEMSNTVQFMHARWTSLDKPTEDELNQAEKEAIKSFKGGIAFPEITLTDPAFLLLKRNGTHNVSDFGAMANPGDKATLVLTWQTLGFRTNHLIAMTDPSGRPKFFYAQGLHYRHNKP